MWFSFYENWFNKQLNIADFNYAEIYAEYCFNCNENGQSELNEGHNAHSHFIFSWRVYCQALPPFWNIFNPPPPPSPAKIFL